MPRFGTSIFFLLLIWFTPLAAATPVFPPLTGRVVDQAQILSPATEADLDGQLAAFEKASGRQLVVATVQGLQGQTIEDYGYQLGRAWGIGEKDKNTGVILLVAPNDRQVRIEVGYGLEGELTDALSRLIIERQILPAFRAGRMEDGVVQGAQAIIAALRGDLVMPVTPPASEPQGDDAPPIWMIIVFIIFIFLARRRRGLLPGVILGSPTIWQGGSRRRSGGFGGGGFRGGGGSFGGGGASGRW